MPPKQEDTLCMNVPDQPSREPVSSDGTVIPLDTVKPPARCRIVAVPARGVFRKRLLAMGIVPGADIEVVRLAPMGDPVEYLVKGYHLSLRKDEAQYISVTRGGA
jgi:ferrous iron transport protein A